MATWSVVGNKVTLTLAPGDTGVIQRSHTFTSADGIVASKKHTFYLDVNADSAAVDAFLQVVGGDLATAGIGAETLTARGYADGSANITVRFGVQHANLGSGGGGAVTYPMNYASKAAAEADGWTVTTGFNYGNAITLGPYTPVMGTIDGSSGIEMRKTVLTGLTPGSTWRLRAWGRGIGTQASWRQIFISLQNINGNSSEQRVSWSGNQGTASEKLSNPQTVGADGNLTVVVDATFPGTFYFAGIVVEPVSSVGGADIEYDNLTFCVGSGLPGPDDPNNPPEEIPDPPPGGWPDPPQPLTRWFDIWNGDLAGTAVWNSTHIRFTPTSAPNILRVCEENDTFVFFTLGPEEDWLLNGVFHEPYWRAQLEALYNDVEARNAILAASTGSSPYTKVRVVHQIMDEPNRTDRYGGSISWAAVERCAVYSKQKFPDLETMLRLQPSHSWYQQAGRAMVGLNSLWAEYHLRKGPIDEYIQTEKAKSQAFSQFCYMGLHYKHFEGPSGPDPRYITPAEMRYYGRDRIAKQPWIRGLGGWKFESGLWAQPGFSAAAIETRDEFALSQP